MCFVSLYSSAGMNSLTWIVLMQSLIHIYSKAITRQPNLKNSRSPCLGFLPLQGIQYIAFAREEYTFPSSLFVFVSKRKRYGFFLCNQERDDRQ